MTRVLHIAHNIISVSTIFSACHIHWLHYVLARVRILVWLPTHLEGYCGNLMGSGILHTFGKLFWAFWIRFETEIWSMDLELVLYDAVLQLGSLDSLLRQVSVMTFWLRANRSPGSIEAMVSFGMQAMGSVAAIWLQLWMWTDMLTLWSIKMLFCWRSDSCWVGWSSDMQSSMSVRGILFVFRYSCNTGIAVTWWGQLM